MQGVFDLAKDIKNKRKEGLQFVKMQEIGRVLAKVIDKGIIAIYTGIRSKRKQDKGVPVKERPFLFHEWEVRHEKT